MVIKAKLIVILISIVLIISSIVVILAIQFGPQTISIHVFNQENNGLSNVEVQGIFPVPTTKGIVFQSVFFGKTNDLGIFSDSNLNLLRDYSNNWVGYQPYGMAEISTPDIVVLLTYNDSSNLYVSELSVQFSTTGFLKGQSYSARGIIDLSKTPTYNQSQLQSTISLQKTVSSQNDNLFSDYIRTCKITKSTCSGWLVNSNSEKVSTLENIPLTMVQADANSFAALMFSIGGTINYNIAMLTGLNTNNPSFNVNEPLWTTNSASGYSLGLIENMTGGIAINGQTIGSSFTYYEINNGILYCFNNSTIFLAGMLNIQTPQIKYISWVKGFFENNTNSHQLTNQYQNYSFMRYNTYASLNSSPGDPKQEIYADQIASVKYLGVDTAVVNIGSILAPLTDYSQKITPISITLTSKNGGLFTAMQFDCKIDYTVEVNYLMSNLIFTVNNDKSMKLAMFIIQLHSIPINST